MVFQELVQLIKSSRHVHSPWYLSRHPEVGHLGMNPAEHYLKYGALMGRDPGRNFNTRFYLETYPEVAESGMNPLVHYVLHGQAKGYLTKSDQKNFGRTIRETCAKLLSLGFTEAPLAELNAIANDSEIEGQYRFLAARELALWFLRQKSAEDWQTALEWVAKARACEPPLRHRLDLAVSELLIHFRLGQYEAGMKAYHRSALAGEVTPRLILARANLEATPEARLVWINQVLALTGIAPLTLSDDTSLPAYDRLRGPSDLPAVADGPKVTVLMAADEAGPMLATALASLQAQTWRNLEILVIDDCSPTPETREIAARFAAADPRIRLIEMPENGGAYVARNRGLDEATGEFVTLNDADDWAHPKKIETQARYLVDNPEVMGCMSQQARAGSGLTFTKWAWGDTVALLRDNISSFMARHKPVFARVGYWDTARFGADDERIRRIRRTFGEGAVHRLQTGPLAFQRDIAGSAVADGPFGADGRFFGARLDYAQGQAHHHDVRRQLNYADRRRETRFATCAAMRPDRVAGQERFDAIIGADLRDGARLQEVLNEIDRRADAGERLGLFQLSRYDFASADTSVEIRERLERTQTTLLVFGERAVSDLLILLDPHCLIHPQRFLPAIEATEIRLHVASGPLSLEPDANLVRQCEMNVRAQFGKTVSWHPMIAGAAARLKAIVPADQA